MNLQRFGPQIVLELQLLYKLQIVLPHLASQSQIQLRNTILSEMGIN